MSREHLDGHLRRHYGSQKLDPVILERLNRLADLERAGRGSGSLDGPRAPGGRGGLRRVAVAAAAVAAVVLVSFVFPGLMNRGFFGGGEALTGSILREIALNHGKDLAVEFSAAGYPRLREQMAELDFALRPSRHLAAEELEMLGGRYCSIQGRLAAQIKLEDEHGSVLTLFQTNFDERFDGLTEVQRELDGIRIRVWREGDLLFALAGSEIRSHGSDARDDRRF
ncbi:MAG: hypothetical protein CL908_16120 [Deltaproteobacteria bacterium]|jgi:hypothetical protein|nr:hypothetical protein [Deltaproteobacteria bacterium]